MCDGWHLTCPYLFSSSSIRPRYKIAHIESCDWLDIMGPHNPSSRQGPSLDTALALDTTPALDMAPIYRDGLSVMMLCRHLATPVANCLAGIFRGDPSVHSGIMIHGQPVPVHSIRHTAYYTLNTKHSTH